MNQVIIDAHCHVGNGFDMNLSVKSLLEEMDKHSVSKSIICTVDKYIAVDNKCGNDEILKYVHKYPDKLIGFAAVNPWYGKKSVNELKRCLKEGMKGLKLHPFLQGFILNDKIVYPLIEEIGKWELPVYIHTGTLVCSEPFQLSYLAQEFPDVNFIMGHGGATDLKDDVILAMEQTGNIYVDTSTNAPGPLKEYIDNLGIQRIIFASNMPVSNIFPELEKIKMICTQKEDLNNIFNLNIKKLINIK